jgi:hypothetical protein
MKLLKGDPTLNAIVLIVAGTVGTATGVGVEGLPLLGTLAVAVAVGLVAGGLLYALISVLKRRRSS